MSLITVIFSIFLIFAPIVCFGEADVLVLGEKVGEDLISNPTSISRFEKEELVEAGVFDIRDIADLTPNFQIIGSNSSRYITPYIRGQGNQDLNLPDEISVTFYLDEIPLPRYAFENDLINIQKVEVLRGPQGTLFGKNTQAGAVLITSQDPSPLRGHEVTIGAGNLGQQLLQGQTNYSLLGNNSLKASTALKLSSRDGWVPDTVLNKDLGEETHQAIQQTFLYSPSDSRRWTLRIAGQRESGTDPFFIARNTANYPVSGQNISPDYRRDLTTNSLKMEERLGNSTLTFITAFNYYDFNVTYDEADLYIVGGPLASDPNVLYRTIEEYDRHYFNELRLSNQLSSRLKLTSGINYSRNNYRLINFVDTFMGFSNQIDQNVKLLGTNLSIFGEGSYEFNQQWILTLGLRGNYDKKEYHSIHQSTAPMPLAYEQNSSETYRDITGKVALSYQWSEQSQSYASLARGYQPGGFPSFQFNNYSGVAEDQVPYQKSHSLAYEIGHKYLSPNQQFAFNTSAYLNDVKNKQIRVRDPDTNLSYYENIDARMFGGEVEASYLFKSPWMIGLNLGHTNSRFKETISTSSNTILKKNDRLSNIPYWNGGAYIQYSDFITSLKGLITARVAYNYTGSRWGENENKTRLSSFGLWRARLAYDRDSYTLALKASNIFDKEYESRAYFYDSVDGEVASPGLPRLISAEFTYRF